MSRGLSRFGIWLGVITLAGFALRIAYVVIYRDQIPIGGDSIYYSVGANLLASGQGFIEPLSLFVRPEQSAGHPPFYLLWLTLPSLVWPDHNATQLVHLVWTCVLGTGSIVLVGLAGREIAGRRVGLIAATLAVVNPNMWVHDGRLLSESAAIFAVALIVLLTYRFINRPSLWRLLWMGFACGLGALARSELLLTVPLVLVPVVLMTARTGWQTKLRWIVAGGLTAALVLAPWVGYNLTRFNTTVTLSTNAGGTLAAANCHSTYYGDIIGYKDYDCAHEVWLAASRREPNWNEFDASQKDKAVQAEAMRYVREHITRVPVVVLARWAHIVGLYQPFREVHWDHLLLRQEMSVGYAIVWTFWGFALLAIAGVVVLRRRHVPVWPLLAFLVIVLVAVGTTFSQTRYRAPMEVSVVLLAAVAIDAAYRAWRASRAAPAPDVDATSAPAAEAEEDTPTLPVSP